MTEEHSLTERVRDVLFHAQYYSSPYRPCPIEPEHILLALLGVDPDLFQVLSATETDEVITALRDDLKAFDPPNRKSWLSSTGPPPLSSAANQVIRLAADESKRLGHTHIGTEHLLLGLTKSRVSELTNESAASRVSEILRERGFSIELVKAQVKAGSLTPQSGHANRSEVLRALPVSARRPASKSFFVLMRKAFHRFRGLFMILVMTSWASPAQLIELSKTSHKAPIESSRRAKPLTYLALGDSTGLGAGSA
jgi:hypothetical protein